MQLQAPGQEEWKSDDLLIVLCCIMVLIGGIYAGYARIPIPAIALGVMEAG